MERSVGDTEVHSRRHEGPHTLTPRIILAMISRLESVPKVHEGLQNFLGKGPMEVECRKVSALGARFSQSLAKRRNLLSQVKLRAKKSGR